MKIQTIAFALFLAVTALACQNDAPQQSSPTGENSPNTSIAESPMPPMTMSPDTTASTGTTTTIVTPPSQEPTGGVALPAGTPNPPHGQPGHVCGTPVGSPLGQSPAGAAKTGQTQAPNPAPAPAKTSPQPAGATTTVAPGTNPPHGQPGHRCDIAVGAPLDSKPKQ